MLHAFGRLGKEDRGAVDEARIAHKRRRSGNLCRAKKANED